MEAELVEFAVGVVAVVAIEEAGGWGELSRSETVVLVCVSPWVAVSFLSASSIWHLPLRSFNKFVRLCWTVGDGIEVSL